MTTCRGSTVDQPCPRCGGTEFDEHECGDDTWDSYSVPYYICRGCGLWFNTWTDAWLVDCESCFDVEDAAEFKPAEVSA